MIADSHVAIEIRALLLYLHVCPLHQKAVDMNITVYGAEVHPNLIRGTSKQLSNIHGLAVIFKSALK
jgi:hypothetical protein